MRWNSPVPHMATIAACTPSRSGMLDGSALPSSTTGAAVREGWVAGEQRRCRERARKGEEHRFAAL
jgi:hypothetical protein